MSYIRSTSNPEGLYIWGDGQTAHIIVGNTNSCNPYTVPSSILNGLIRKFHKKFHDFPCSFKGCSVDEVWVKVDNKGEVVCEVADEVDVDPTRNELRVKLTYGNWKVFMWFVTWEYIVYSKLSRPKSK